MTGTSKSLLYYIHSILDINVQDTKVIFFKRCTVINVCKIKFMTVYIFQVLINRLILLV